MDNKKIKIIIKLLLVFIILIGCNNKKKERNNLSKSQNKDTFYLNSSDFDLIRFPLIKPYQVISIDDGNSWSIKSDIKPKKINDINDINNINQISNYQDCFLIHSLGKTIVKGQEVNEAWYVVFPKDSVVKSFTKENNFSNYIKDKCTSKIEWKTPQVLFKQFDETNCLGWIPKCK
jgi:PBP1b-binding outer membrane lipoprotein LpoB